ncbi:hypothetical protein, partial [Streptomyces sp. SID8014]|uniref:hypothetical protein n=1 Tax=Streptomyces sp. SID8014 TaxID=2706097 RepID=UPI0019417CDE
TPRPLRLHVLPAGAARDLRPVRPRLRPRDRQPAPRLPAAPRPCRPRHDGGHPMICARCQQPIESGQQYDRLTPDGGSVGKPDVYRHLACPGRRAS